MQAGRGSRPSPRLARRLNERGNANMRSMIATLSSLIFITAVGSAAADPIADFYRDKTINLILSAGPGGGYTSYAHAFAPYLAAHIPGRPKIVVQNMPGAGGIRAMIYFQSVAPKDGTTL